MGLDDFAFADRPESFTGFCLDSDFPFGDAENRPDPFGDGPFVSGKPGPFGEDHAVDIDHGKAEVGGPVGGFREHCRGVAATVFRGGIGKHLADVSQHGGPHDCIGDSVQQDVGIAVSGQLMVEIDVDSTQPERPAGHKAVGVVSDSDPVFQFAQDRKTPARGTCSSVALTRPERGSGFDCNRPQPPDGARPAERPGLPHFIREFSPYNRGMSIIEIRQLFKSYRVYQKREGLLASVRSLFRREYRQVDAVRGIDLTVEKGEFVAFLGPNGAGKTTTLKLLSGVITPSSGSATVMGHTPSLRENEYRRRFALVMGQKNQLWWDLPAADSFRLHQHIYRIDAARFNRTRDELSEMLDVARLLHQPVRELSLGERMKMELIAALLHSPEVLFLDEPTIGLDVVAQHRIQQFLRSYQQEQGVTVLLTSHYMKDIVALCRRVVIIAAGRIHYDGSLAGIVDRFSSDKVVTLQLGENEDFSGLEQMPGLISIERPRIRFRVNRNEVAATLSRLLTRHQVDDVVVEDPPLENVIASMFSEAGAATAAVAAAAS